VLPLIESVALACGVTAFPAALYWVRRGVGVTGEPAS
jgi:hypothetical protein